MSRRRLPWAFGVVVGLFTGACFDPPPTAIEDGSSGSTTGASASETGDTPVDPDGMTTAVDPDSGSADGGVACATSEVCVDLAPDGWDGPVAYFEGAELASLPSCAAPFGGLDVELYDALSAPPAECSSCSCGAASDVECSSPSVRFYNNSNCFGDSQSEFQLGLVDECVVFPNAVGAYGAESDPVAAVEGTGACTPTGADATLPSPVWGTALRACAPPPSMTACGDGQVCAPAPGEPFAPGLCIHRPGDVACPAGQYDQRMVRYAAVDDGRSCAACNCGTPQGGSCTAEILFSYTNTCTDDYLHLVNPGSGGCTTLWGDEPSSGMLLVTGVSGASCSASGGEPQGEVTPAEPVTFCCTGQ